MYPDSGYKQAHAQSMCTIPFSHVGRGLGTRLGACIQLRSSTCIILLNTICTSCTVYSGGFHNMVSPLLEVPLYMLGVCLYIKYMKIIDDHTSNFRPNDFIELSKR